MKVSKPFALTLIVLLALTVVASGLQLVLLLCGKPVITETIIMWCVSAMIGAALIADAKGWLK